MACANEDGPGGPPGPTIVDMMTPGAGPPTAGGGTPPGGGDRPAATMSAGHQWCLAAQGKIINNPRAEMMWAASASDAWLLTNHGMAIDGLPPPNSPPGTPGPIIGLGRWATLIHWNGSTFCAIPHTFLTQRLGVKGAIRSLWGSGPSDVWAVGELDSAIRWDGQSWQRITITANSDELTAVAGTSPDDVYVAADKGGGGPGRPGGDLMHWNGSAWRPIRPEGQPINFYKLSRMWLDEDADFWLTWIDSTTNGPPGCKVMLIQAGVPDCVLDNGLVVEDLHGHGIQPWVLARDIGKTNYSIWTLENRKWRSFPFPERLHVVRARSNSNVWAAGVGGIWRWDGTEWQEPDPSTAGITGLWTSPAGEVWAWGEKGVYIWTGQSWRRLSG